MGFLIFGLIYSLVGVAIVAWYRWLDKRLAEIGDKPEPGPDNLVTYAAFWVWPVLMFFGFSKEVRDDVRKVRSVGKVLGEKPSKELVRARRELIKEKAALAAAQERDRVLKEIEAVRKEHLALLEKNAGIES